jgi:alkyl sulfatase BDS1-like metallo-beta-lactamase superfamily hydrolase
MSKLLDRSDRYVDTGVIDGPVEELSLELDELTDDIAMVDGFSHVVTCRTSAGLVLFDTSMPWATQRALTSIRGWSNDPVHTLVYTHGHVDHVGGAYLVLKEADNRGDRRPDVVAHEAVPRRFARYDQTSGYNGWINRRQFGGTGLDGDDGTGPPRFFDRWVQPSVTYAEAMDLRVGDTHIELHHGRGETDDHTWAWLPEHRAVVAGDFLIWVFPNAGNPQKVQRYPLEWARVLRQMAAKEPELLLPAHGLPIRGRQRVAMVLDEVASALELVVEQTLAMMNDGAPLDAIVHTVKVPDEQLARPWLRPVYDEPEFVVRNVWRRYGGWYDGNPARLKPAPDAALSTEVAALAGGVPVLVRRALELAEAGDDTSLRLACHLVEAAVQAAPEDVEAHRARADVYGRRRKVEASLMAKGIYGFAARQSSAVADGDGDGHG